MSDHASQRRAGAGLKKVPLIGHLSRKLVHLLTRFTGTWVGSPDA